MLAKREESISSIDGINHDWERPIEVRQIKYLNNIVEQDHRAIKRVTKQMLNFKSFRSLFLLEIFRSFFNFRKILVFIRRF
jgi:transposase-like protein